MQYINVEKCRKIINKYIDLCRKISYNKYIRGEMSEWSKEHAWKVCIGLTLSGVQIPFSPPVSIFNMEDYSSG